MEHYILLENIFPELYFIGMCFVKTVLRRNRMLSEKYYVEKLFLSNDVIMKVSIVIFRPNPLRRNICPTKYGFVKIFSIILRTPKYIYTNKTDIGR